MQLKTLRMRTLQFIQYVCFRLVCFVLNLVPFPWAMKLGQLTGDLLYCVLHHYRSMALENLHHAFGLEKNEADIKKIATQSFENLGYFAIEFLRTRKIAKQIEKYVVIKNEEAVLQALSQNKGLILVVSHLGNWEWMGVAAGIKARQRGVKINLIGRIFGNPFLHEYLVKRLRGMAGIESVDKKGAARGIIKLLDRNEIVTVMIDQHERIGSVPVPYFGRDAWTTSLPAVMALKKGTPVIPAFSYRRLGKPTLVELGEPFPLIQTQHYKSDVIENTKQYVRSIEEAVRKKPGDWLWMHARWRTSQTAKIVKK